MAFVLGKANYGQRAQKNYFKIKEGDNPYRILPPMFGYAQDGIWNKYYAVEYGYKNSLGKMCPFLDVRVTNRKTKMVEVESPAYLFRMELKADLDAAIDALKAGKGSKEAVQEAKDLTERFNMDAKYYVNAIDLQGNIGLLKIGSKAMQSLREEMKRLEGSGIDPLSVENGRFFNFKRSGKGRETMYSVVEYKQKKVVIVDGSAMEVDVPFVHVLTDDIINRLEREAFDLSKIYKSVTVEQVQDLVDNGPIAADRIFASAQAPVVAAPVEDDEELPEEKYAPKAPAQDLGFVKPIVQESKAPVAPPAPAPIIQPKAQAKPANNMAQENEDYLRSLGIIP
jgi:hypothetical protein